MPFKDPIAPKQKKREGQKEWSFKAPSYDNRTSCSVSAGDDYGVGYKTPQKAKMFSPDGIFSHEDISG